MAEGANRGMAKDFRIVEPEFVTKAKQSAVAAVESRFAREEAQRRKVERRARVKGCFAWLILIAIAAAAGLYFVGKRYGIGFSEVSMRVHEAVQTRRYERIEEMFRIAPIAEWRTAPDDVRPGKVATNTTYYALMPDGDGRALLELSAQPGGGMRVWRLSPLADPVELQAEAFQAFAARTPYLISVNGTVYFCTGKRAAMDKNVFRATLFSAGKPVPPKKGR